MIEKVFGALFGLVLMAFFILAFSNNQALAEAREANPVLYDLYCGGVLVFEKQPRINYIDDNTFTNHTGSYYVMGRDVMCEIRNAKN